MRFLGNYVNVKNAVKNSNYPFSVLAEFVESPLASARPKWKYCILWQAGKASCTGRKRPCHIVIPKRWVSTYEASLRASAQNSSFLERFW